MTKKKIKVHDEMILVLQPTMLVKKWLEHFVAEMDESPEVVAKISMEKFEENACVYVLPIEVKTPEEGLQFVKRHFSELFEFELKRYVIDKHFWPKKLDYETFIQFFRFHFHPICKN